MGVYMGYDEPPQTTIAYVDIPHFYAYASHATTTATCNVTTVYKAYRIIQGLEEAVWWLRKEARGLWRMFWR